MTSPACGVAESWFEDSDSFVSVMDGAINRTLTFDIEPAEAVAEVLWFDPNHPS